MRPSATVPPIVTVEIRDFAESLPMALLQAREAAMRLFRPMLATHELTEQQWRVLRALNASNSPLEVGAIVDATFLLAPSLSRILSNLESRSLITRMAVVNDQRRAEISLTEAGRDLVQRVAPESETIYNRIETAFGRTRLQALLGDLADLRDATNEAVAEAGAEVTRDQ